MLSCRNCTVRDAREDFPGSFRLTFALGLGPNHLSYLELLVEHAVQLPIGFLHSNEQGWTALQPYHLGSFKASKPSDNLSQIDQSNNLDAAKQPSQPTQPTQPTFQVVDAVSS